MGYAETLAQQAGLRAWYGSPAGKEQLLEITRLQDPAVDPDLVQAGGQRVLVGLHLGVPFWVGASLADLLVAAEATWPGDGPFTARMLPEAHGFVWFERPLPLPLRHDGARRDLCALSWSSYAVFDDQEFVPLQSNGQGDEGVYLVAYTRINTPIPGVIGCLPLPFSDSGPPRYPHAKAGINPVTVARMDRVARYFAAFCALVAQRILAVARREVLNRGARRRLAKEAGPLPAVRVVELRRREYRRRDDASGEPVAWSCQWLVRGHWHRYHTREGLQPRWVAPYLKGDPDKPLKPTLPTAYEVVR